MNCRSTDRCITKRLWDAGTPYIQSGGFFTILGALGTLAWYIVTFVATTQAAIPQVAANTADIQTVKQNVAVMKQEVDDIYNVVVRRK